MAIDWSRKIISLWNFNWMIEKVESKFNRDEIISMSIKSESRFILTVISLFEMKFINKYTQFIMGNKDNMIIMRHCENNTDIWS